MIPLMFDSFNVPHFMLWFKQFFHFILLEEPQRLYLIEGMELAVQFQFMKNIHFTYDHAIESCKTRFNNMVNSASDWKRTRIVQLQHKRKFFEILKRNFVMLHLTLKQNYKKDLHQVKLI
jgi:hypothetical protein